MEFCQYILSEAGRAVFIEDSKIYSKQLSYFNLKKILWPTANQCLAAEQCLVVELQFPAFA